MTKQTILEDLGNNLILRRSTPEDAEALGKFNGLMHVDEGEEFVDHISLWVKELLAGKHPTFNTDDFTIVEDASTGEIVSSLCLINQTWAYGGIQFGVGRPELVATHPDYRRRGLVRKQFDVVHQSMAERGQKLQFITGIPWYYRQFGYEMAVNLGGGKLGSADSVPQLKADQKEAFNFRQAVLTDITFITKLYADSTKRSLLSCVRDEDIWHHELTGRPPMSSFNSDEQIIEDLDGNPLGYLIFGTLMFSGKIFVIGYKLTAGTSWLTVTPAVQRRAKQVGEEYAVRDTTSEKPVELKTIYFNLGEDHPSYQIAHPNSLPITNNPYAFYLRVPDTGFPDDDCPGSRRTHCQVKCRRLQRRAETQLLHRWPDPDFRGRQTEIRHRLAAARCR